MDNSKEQRRCKNCGLLTTYIKIKAKQKVCKTCGFIENLKNLNIKKEGEDE
jgi:ribosomal protein L37E